MKAKFSVNHLLMLVGLLIGCLLIGCSETDHDVSNDVLYPSLLSSHESNPSLRPAVSVDTVVQPLPSMTEKFSPLPLKQEEVAAAPPLLLVVVPIVSCGAAALDISTLVWDTPKFLSNHTLFVSAIGMACPADKVVKGIKILKSVNTLRKIKFGNFTRWNFRKNFERLIGRQVRPGYEVHHAIPQKYRTQAGKLGINIDQPWHGIEIGKRYHDFITPNYTKDWDKFFKLPDLNQSKILNYEQFMLNKYHLKRGSYLELTK